MTEVLQRTRTTRNPPTKWAAKKRALEPGQSKAPQCRYDYLIDNNDLVQDCRDALKEGAIGGNKKQRRTKEPLQNIDPAKYKVSSKCPSSYSTLASPRPAASLAKS